MIRKLKIKMVAYMMLLITFVIAVAFTALYIGTAKRIETSSSIAMKSAAESVRTGFFHDGRHNENLQDYFSIFTIDLNEQEMTFSIYGYTAEQNELTESVVDYINELIAAVHAESDTEGVLKDYQYRYLVVNTLLGERIVLLDRGYETQTLSNLLLTLSLVSVCVTIAFLLISIFIAKVAVAPVEKSWTQQKQFIADASHELKTPITVISANTDIVLSHGDSTVAEQSKWLNNIKAESARMCELVNNMLYLAKNEDAKNMAKTELLCLSDLAAEGALPFESVCFERKKQLLINIEPDIWVKGCRSSLLQLISILLDNACKYSNENGHIEFHLFSDGDRAEMVVRNSGEPILPSDIDRIFERFYRADKARTRTEGGYGLGLSIAKTIIDSHGAKVAVSSTKENGTIFKCTFRKASAPSKPAVQ